MRLPSGDHAGSAPRELKRRMIRPLALATTIFPPRTKATNRPSGDHEGARASPARRRTRREPSGRMRHSPPWGPAEYVSNEVGVRAEPVAPARASDVPSTPKTRSCLISPGAYPGSGSGNATGPPGRARERSVEDPVYLQLGNLNAPMRVRHGLVSAGVPDSR